MSLENIVGNIVRGIVVASSLYTAGCGTNLHIQKGDVWYNCNTNEDYPSEHPCYAEIEAYKERMAAASVSTAFSRDECTSSSGCFSDQRCSFGRCVSSSISSNTTEKSGHYVCKSKKK